MENFNDKTRLSVCLVSPLPPPLGGIGRWTTLLLSWASTNPLITIVHVDISPRWRAIDDVAIWKRVVGGGLQLMRDYGRFIASVWGTDVIHLTTSGQLAVVRDLAICTTAKLLRIPVVYHLHFGRIPEIARANTFEWRMLLSAMKLAKVVLPLDAASACTVHEHLPQKKVEITPNPVDLATFPPLSSPRNSKKTLLFVGWLLQSKGVEDLLSAWNNLPLNDWELLIAGPGASSYQDDLKSRFTPHNVRFIGEVPHEQVLQLIADCNLFVLPSHTEAFPFVVLEAMALGRAIIATDVGAIPEMLSGDCGILVKPKDEAGLSAVLKTLSDDDNLRSEYGRRARARVIANYTVDAVYGSLLTLWRQTGEK